METETVVAKALTAELMMLLFEKNWQMVNSFITVLKEKSEIRIGGEQLRVRC
ncbi:hypothetical protein DOY81_007048 [Sarcophaga bullata]|nr:hypothetical protein DOY81_007048 [Sarcophaga bullata]